jgi:hypothetical protein
LRFARQREGEAMRLLWLGLFALAAAGCAGDGRYTWDDVLKDARGDNMQMRSGWGSKSQASSDSSNSSNTNGSSASDSSNSSNANK